jgi:hypothetical protein
LTRAEREAPQNGAPGLSAKKWQTAKLNVERIRDERNRRT